jgi:hypothetical protein
VAELPRPSGLDAASAGRLLLMALRYKDMLGRAFPVMRTTVTPC